MVSRFSTACFEWLKRVKATMPLQVYIYIYYTHIYIYIYINIFILYT